MNKKQKLTRLITAAIFIALTFVMTFVPQFGYISYGGVIEITTLHILIIYGACVLGPAYGALLGGMWGLSCVLRATTNPLWGLFLNPLISVVPRILVGLVAGLVFKALKKTKVPKAVSLGIAAVAGTLTNTVLVLTAIQFTGDWINVYANLQAIVQNVYGVLISVNGILELVAAVILVPALYLGTEKAFKNRI